MKLYVFEILRTTVGDVKTLKEIEEIHKNSVRFTDQTTNGKSMIKEVDEWIDVTKHEPDYEVIALGYQDEMIIGFIGGEDGEYECESEGVILEKVTHWRPKPFTSEQMWSCFNKR